jgi:hypothetical protein
MSPFWGAGGHTGSCLKACGLGVLANGGDSLDIGKHEESLSFLKVKGCSTGILICFLAVVGLLRRRKASGFFIAFEGGFDNDEVMHMT